MKISGFRVNSVWRKIQCGVWSVEFGAWRTEFSFQGSNFSLYG